MSTIPLSIEVLLQRAESGDEDARLITDDWMESELGVPAETLWRRTNPTKFQQDITVIVIGKGTTLAQITAAVEADKVKNSYYYRGTCNLSLEHVLAESQRQLRIHTHARWVRFIRTAATTPRNTEVLLDAHHTPYLNTWRWKGSPTPVGYLRARCAVPGCVILSTGTFMVEKKDG